MSFLAAIFVYVYVPETKRRTLEEIQNLWSPGGVPSRHRSNSRRPVDYGDSRSGMKSDEGLLVLQSRRRGSSSTPGGVARSAS